LWQFPGERRETTKLSRKISGEKNKKKRGRGGKKAEARMASPELFRKKTKRPLRRERGPEEKCVKGGAANCAEHRRTWLKEKTRVKSQSHEGTKSEKEKSVFCRVQAHDPKSRGGNAPRSGVRGSLRFKKLNQSQTCGRYRPSQSGHGIQKKIMGEGRGTKGGGPILKGIRTIGGSSSKHQRDESSQ